MGKPYFITAIGTPLTEDEELHQEGLALELTDQWSAGIDGLLVAGTMGAMQLLADQTYRQLIERSVELSKGRGEILVGVGDAGFTRTRDRIMFTNQFKIDGVAVLAPFFWKFGQSELVEYFTSLADISKAPLYLYDLPPVVGTKLSMETVLKLSKHPNIRGIKASCEIEFIRSLSDRVGDSFRIIIASPFLVDMLLRFGLCNHLDGMWSLAPRWTVEIGRCAARGDWQGAAESQRKMTELKEVPIVSYGFSAFTDIMNARGIPGRFAPRPFPSLSQQRREQLLGEPIVQRLIKEDPAPAS